MKKKGFTLIEIIVTASIFALVGVGFYQVYTTIITTTNTLRLKNMALFVANSQIELVRNAAYSDVGIAGGLPTGIFNQTSSVNMNGVTFQIDKIIRSIDEPFDGTIGGQPDDLSPADNKLVQVTVSCPVCADFNPIALTARVAPRHLESSSTNGAMRIRVFDSGGSPIQGARVQIDNDSEDPPISFVDTTNDAGQLLIVDAPPGLETYQISVLKDGFSSERTYAAGEDGVLNPVKLNLTVATGTVAEASFAIDIFSDLSLASVTTACIPVPDLGFRLTGSKLLSSDPDLLKYDVIHQTNGAGILTINDLEWDTYTINTSDETYMIVGMSPINPFSVDPGQSEEILLVSDVIEPYMLTVVVLDNDTGLPLADADVSVVGPGSYAETQTTNVGTQQQGDWSGGGGQNDFINESRFYDQSGVDYVTNPGQIQLQSSEGVFVSPGQLISSTFDMGEDGIIRSFSWDPLVQVTGEDSLRFQLASNNDNNTWDFVGPDGTSATYYTATNRTVHAGHEGDRYLRYKAYLSTVDTGNTPILANTFLAFTSSCVPPGQVTFSGLPQVGNYDVSASLPGYSSATSTVSVSEDWQNVTLRLETSL